MSDTAWFGITFKTSDLEKINEVLKDEMWNGKWWDEAWENSVDCSSGSKCPTMTANIYEANYGGVRITDALIKANIPFGAAYGSGGSYGPGAIVFYEGEQEEMSTDIEGSPVVVVDKDGVSENELQQAKRFYKILDQVQEYFKEA